MIHNTQQFVCYICCHSLYQWCVLFRLAVRIKEAEIWTDVNEVPVRCAPLRISVIQVGALNVKHEPFP
jgi:hypothetical protein